MDITDLGEVFLVITQIISVLGCLWFIKGYRKFSKKTLTLRMISILNITYLIFHCCVLLFLHIQANYEDQLKTFRLILSNILRFSVFWACSIVFVVYRSILRNGKTNSKLYFRCSLITVIFLTISFVAL